MRRMDTAERRARLALRHHLARPADDVVSVADDLLGLHATDPASVFVSAQARVAGLTPAAMERALYDERRLARVLAMRRTMFVVPTTLVPVLHAATARALAPRERRRTARMLEDAGVTDDGARWVADAEDATVRALADAGPATAAELSEVVPALRQKISYGRGRWAGRMGMSTRVLFLLATDGRIVRARPRGSWTSSQYRWALLSDWLGVDVDAEDAAGARREVARRWLATYGPATLEDLVWWTGWPKGQTRKALAAIDTVEVDLEGAPDPGIVLADDVAPGPSPPPWVALLPALDPTVMGWRHRGWYLGDHRQALFDRNGNAGPTIWCDGRIVGGWAQTASGEIATELLEDIGAERMAAVSAVAEDLTVWFGDVRITPRFRTPLERRLRG